MEAKKEERVNLNKGHRQRMRMRYEANGLESFRPHEVLELLLFYVQPYKDTNKIAHRLINQFHTLAGVMDASAHELMEVDGVGEKTALFLNLLPDVFRLYQISRSESRSQSICSTELKKFLADLYIGERMEKAYVFCLDGNSRMFHMELVAEGSGCMSRLQIQSVAEIALRKRCSSLILAHNHPDGSSHPSSDDIFTTHRLYNALYALDIILTDHCIVGDCVLSLRENGYWDEVC